MSQDITLTKPIGEGAPAAPTGDLGVGDPPRRRLGSWQVAPGATDALPQPARTRGERGSFGSPTSDANTRTMTLPVSETPAAPASNGVAETIRLAPPGPAPYVMSASDATLPYSEREVVREQWEARQALATAEGTSHGSLDVTAPIASGDATATMPLVTAVGVTAPMPAVETAELTSLRQRVTADPDDLDATLELALALHEASRSDEASNLLTSLLVIHESQGAVDEAQQIRRLIDSVVTAKIDLSTTDIGSRTTDIGSRTTDLEGATTDIGAASAATAPMSGTPGRTTLQLSSRTAPLNDRAGGARDGRQRAAPSPAETTDLFPREQLIFTDPLAAIGSMSAVAAELFAVAEEERRDGHLRTALDTLNHAISMAPSASGLWVRLAELRIRLGHRQKAREVLEGLRPLTGDGADTVPGWMVERLLLHTRRPEIDVLERVVRLLTEAGETEYGSSYAAALIQRLDAAGKHEDAVDCAAKMAAAMPGDTRVALEGAVLAVRLASHGEVIDLWEAAVAAGADAEVAKASMAASVASASEDDHWRLLAETLDVVRRDPHSLAREAYMRTADAVGASPVLKAGRALVMHAVDDPASKSALAAAAGDRHGSPIGRAAASIALAYRLSEVEKDDEYIAAVRTTLTLMADDALRSHPSWVGLVGVEPDLAALGTELGEALLAAGDAAGAVEILRSWHQHARGNGPLVRLLADAYGRTGQVGSALTILDELGMHHRKAGELDEMAAVLRQMSRLAPTNIKVKSRLIDAYLQRGFVAEARAELIQRADLETQAGLIKEACTSLQRAADLSWNLGFMNESFTLYDRLLALDPEDVGNRSALVNLYLQVGRLTEAAEHQRAVVDLALKHGRRHEAIAALHQVIGLTPDDMTAYYQLGELLSSMGEYQQAEKVYRRIVLMSPDDAIAQAKATSMAALKERMTAG